MATTEQISQEQELKERLKRQLDDVHDIALLRGVSLLLGEVMTSGEQTVYQLSSEVRKSIERAMQQDRDGLSVSGDTVREEIDQWLKND